MQIAPHIGWANAIPDAHATIDLVVNDEALVFTGTGYHDKVRILTTVNPSTPF